MTYPDAADVLKIWWYAKPNDVVGGWSIMPVDETPSQGGWEVGTFLTREVAEHLTFLHNYRIGVQRDRAVAPPSTDC